MKVLLIALALLLVATPVTAQPARIAPYVAMVSANAADLWTTKLAFDRGAVEGNGFVCCRPMKTLIVAKSAWVLALANVMHLLESRGHPKWAKAIGYIDASVLFGVSAHNHRVAR